MAPEADVGWGPDEAVTRLYAAHYGSLVRLAALLLRDSGAAEEVVQDAFVAMHGRWGRLRDPERALGYLRTAVVNRSRSALRHRAVVAAHPPLPPHDVPGADTEALARVDRERILGAMALLPSRQREALVLRYYADLSEAQIAAAMGVSAGSVKRHASRGLAALRDRLGETGGPA